MFINMKIHCKEKFKTSVRTIMDSLLPASIEIKIWSTLLQRDWVANSSYVGSYYTLLSIFNLG